MHVKDEHCKRERRKTIDFGAARGSKRITQRKSGTTIEIYRKL